MSVIAAAAFGLIPDAKRASLQIFSTSESSKCWLLSFLLMVENDNVAVVVAKDAKVDEYDMFCRSMIFQAGSMAIGIVGELCKVLLFLI